MSDEARRLLERAETIIGMELEPAPAHMQPSGTLKGAAQEVADWLKSARAFLAQPTAAREAVLVAALWEDKHQHDHGNAHCTRCMNAQTKCRDALADTSPAAAALLAQGDEWDFLCSLLKTFAEGLDSKRRRALRALPARAQGRRKTSPRDW